MIVLPYWTNAPIYYYPLITVLLIIANCVVSIYALLNPDQLAAWILHVDGTLDPWTWLTSFFIHADYAHLIGNMIFLWCFGVIVEGRIGHIGMLLAYMAVGLIQAAGLQLMMVAFSQIEPLQVRGALGASSAIYGLIVMSFLWSFDDDLISLVVLYPFYINYGLEVSVGIYCVIYLGFDVLETLMQGWSSGLLHVTGAAVGLAVGLVVTFSGLVKGPTASMRRWIQTLPDTGREIAQGMNLEVGDSKKQHEQLDEQQKAELHAKKLAKAQKQVHKIKALVDLGQVELAEERMRQLVVTDPLVHWEPTLLRSMIEGHIQNRAWDRADFLLNLFVEQFPNLEVVPIRIRWAQTKLQQEMPRKALSILKGLQGTAVSQGQKKVIQDLADHAKQMISEGTIELE